MKAKQKHVLPLSSSAVDLLATLSPTVVSPDTPIFAIAGAKRSNMAMTMLLRRMGRSDIWVGDATEYPREIVEQALAHTMHNKAERAYRRGNAVERRRSLMEAWALFLSQEPGDAQGTSFGPIT